VAVNGARQEIKEATAAALGRLESSCLGESRSVPRRSAVKAASVTAVETAGRRAALTREPARLRPASLTACQSCGREEMGSHTSLARSWSRRQEAPCGVEATSRSRDRVERMSEGAALALQQAPVTERSRERVASL